MTKAQGTSVNLEPDTVAGFGVEWTRFDQSALAEAEAQRYFAQYFAVFPWHALPPDAVGADIGCGTGRWAKFVAERVGTLHCVDASVEALEVARRNLHDRVNCIFHHASVDDMDIADGSLDFAYSLGVLHHVPDTLAGLRSCVAKLKPGAPLLIYLYYALENRPSWYRVLWRSSDLVRRAITRLSPSLRTAAADAIAASVYWPLARTARLGERLGLPVSSLPLSAYRGSSFYTMRTDALDRFGTRLERRFTRAQIANMMTRAGMERVQFAQGIPFWCAVGYRRSPG